MGKTMRDAKENPPIFFDTERFFMAGQGKTRVFHRQIAFCHRRFAFCRNSLPLRRNCLPDRRNGLADRRNWLADRRNWFADARNGFADRRNRFVDCRNGLVGPRNESANRRIGSDALRNWFANCRNGLSSKLRFAIAGCRTRFPGCRSHPDSVQKKARAVARAGKLQMRKTVNSPDLLLLSNSLLFLPNPVVL